MNVRKAITYGAPLALATLLHTTSAQALFYNNVYELIDRTVTGDSFNANLAREYQELAKFESEKMYDWSDAEKHAAKGNLAAAGKTPLPYDPAEWDIENKASLTELQEARFKLMSAFNAGARDMVPALAATAQAKFDCWVEQQEEGHQPAHIAACKDAFMTAMASVDAAMAPKEVVEAPVATVTTVSQEIARELVYFDFDKADITPAEAAKIEQFVSRMRTIDGVELKIVGHADTSGPSDYNQKLSAARAKAVTDKLIDQGMEVRSLDDLAVVAEGEARPAVATGDGVKEPRNRRVEIVAVGDVEVNQTVSSINTQ